MFLCFFVIHVFILCNVVLSKLNFQNEQLAAAFFESHKDYLVTKGDIVDGIEKCWFNITDYLINESIKQEKDFSNDVKTAVNSMKQKLDQLLTVSYSIKKIDTVNASFQWAQSPEYIFLNIKFSHRWSSPGALKVKDEEVISRKNIFTFSALSNDSNSITKKYIVDLILLHNIIESETKYNFASVGKVVFTLKKEKKEIWDRLLLSKEKNPNMQVWWDMKEKYQDSIQDFLKEEEKKKKKDKGKKDSEKDEEKEKTSANANNEKVTTTESKNDLQENENLKNGDVGNEEYNHMHSEYDKEKSIGDDIPSNENNNNRSNSSSDDNNSNTNERAKNEKGENDEEL
ncbi:co-chaperone p23, putative [Plasmodium malariae]|uniref:Co-chaperone p23, putative n=1 Tax=Plasmodium malariae TaxID=5858 RepID=A0A1C3KYK1_PLAMA|nr:co-chaperone p23, putative [Plasmodium malariae]